MENKEETIGLSTSEALTRLCKEIECTLQQFHASHRQKCMRAWLLRSFHHNSHYTNINWLSIVFLLLCASNLIIASLLDSNHVLVWEALAIIVLLTVGVCVELFDNRLRQNEVRETVSQVIRRIRDQISRIKWKEHHYPELSTPFSPCITLQWTHRDNNLVNLPWSLLVKDDIIIMRPGQHSPGYCEALEKTDFPLLHAKEVYAPSIQNANEIFSIPRARKPLNNRKYRLLETPYVGSLKVALEQGVDRPISPHHKQLHLLMSCVIERILLPIVAVLILSINFIRFTYMDSVIGQASPIELFFIVTTSTMLPLLPIVFPLAWNILNCAGMARFQSFYEESLRTADVNASHTQVFDDEDGNNEEVRHIGHRITYTLLWKNFIDVFLGRSSMLPRTANILHVLGSVTALCCIDKKGILSWPNPTAEKVFFLHRADDLSNASSLANLTDLHTDASDLKCDEHLEENGRESIAEVLDVTFNPKDPFKLHFDDRQWHKHLNSLKPLGLAILLNTCHKDTQAHYTHFCSHISCEAMYNENLVPVTNRRCLCDLSREIGFVDQARRVFTLEQQLSTFRHLQPEMVRRDNKYARSLSLSTKLKFPFPHMFAVVVKEINSGSFQLLSQGTGDIILDSCVDYWDGYDLNPLTTADRKKIQDFYQRCSLTAYCSAFAYRPLTNAVSDTMSSVYLELPSDSRHLYHCHRSPTPVHWDCRSVLEPKLRAPLGPFFSTDSLLYNEPPTTTELQDADLCFDMQCNQVLIGMVTMQYQVQADMVHLIEQLERACIRFVHFSKENELRSRVFSEKMGLESGWNCHISLLSDRNRQGTRNAPEAEWSRQLAAQFRRKSQSDRRLNSSEAPTNGFQTVLHSNLEPMRAMSFSAPSAINTEQTIVKFDTECRERSPRRLGLHDDEKEPHDWQSLSCLTDSTEHSAPIHFDMSNRAKLPRGIDKIRPHIELIDNVPLLVSLFTDCTSSSTKEMLSIMQEYGEIVCVMGSSANNQNMGVFLQADASIGVEPLYPQVCQKRRAYKATPEEIMSPLDVSRALNSITCSLSLKRENPVSIYQLVMEARHYMWNLWNTVQFWVSCCISLTVTQLLAAMLMMPPVWSPGHVLWIVGVIIPIMSVSLMGSKTDPDVMKKAQEKNQIGFNADVSSFVCRYYGLKFLPAVVAILVVFTYILASYCSDLCKEHKCHCVFYYLPLETRNGTFIGGWTDSVHSETLRYAQNICTVTIIIHFIFISIGFVHREHNIWTRLPCTNYMWIGATILVIVLQTFYTLGNLIHILSRLKVGHSNMTIMLIALVPAIGTLFVGEAVKRMEIKVNLRQQRRIRLEFGTKLGMNSPF